MRLRVDTLDRCAGNMGELGEIISQTKCRQRPEFEGKQAEN